ncbi:MAG: type II CAAX endopeptidase family protein [Candidatus Kapaibacterium sp.]
MKILITGISIAACLWFLMFSHFPEIAVIIHTQYFWYAMTFSTVFLSCFSLYTQRRELAKIFAFQWKFVWIGILHAVILYGMSRLGVYIFSHFFDGVMPQIESIYQTRTQLSPAIIAPLLFFLIAPAEEIFWRGFVHHKLMEKYGVTQGTIIGICLYSGVHIWALNPMLLLAALVLGVHWSLMYRRFHSIIPGIISHAIWDTAIFVLLPVTF